MDELKPCPFCGDTRPTLAPMRQTWNHWNRRWEGPTHSIRCRMCDCAARLDGYSETSVIAAWNRRDPSARNEAIEVSS